MYYNSIWELLFSFKGRVNRLTFWVYNICASIVSILAFVVIFSLFPLDPSLDMSAEGILMAYMNAGQYAAVLIFVATYLALTWAGIAISVKRWHDRNKSGWWVLIYLIPFLNIWAVIETGFLAGTPGPNRYDTDPAFAQDHSAQMVEGEAG